LKRVLIISTSLEEQNKIQGIAQYQNPGALAIETTASFGQDITYWTTQAPDVLILQMPDDDLLQSYFFTKLRKDVSKNQPMIILCSTISSSLMQLSTEFSKVRMLKTPVEGFALYRGLIDLLADYKQGQRQVHPRYLTDQKIEIHSDFFDGRMTGQMKNLSLSGAYFESEDKTFEVQVGDFIKLSIFIGQPPKQYVFDVRVVWRKDQNSGAAGFGVTFVDKEEVYNHLLKHL
jgi:hypothetical protein